MINMLNGTKEESVKLVRVLGLGLGVVRVDEVICTCDDELAEGTEDFLVDAHREMLPGFVYEGFLETEIVYTEGALGGSVLGVHQCTLIECTIVEIRGV